MLKLQFDKKLKIIFFRAKSRVIEERNVDAISTLDLFTELVEDSESILYEALSYMNSEEEISEQLDKLREESAKNKNVDYPIEITIEYEENEESAFKIRITKQLYKYLESANDLSNSINLKAIRPQDVIIAIIKEPIQPITKFLRKLYVDIPGLRETFEEILYSDDTEEDQVNSKIPEDMLTYLYAFSGDDAICGRDKELEDIWNILLKKNKRNVILVGDQGVWKTAIVRKIASQIKNGTSPVEFRNYNIYLLDVNAIVAGTKYRGDAEQRFKNLISFIKQQKNVILFIDEAHMLLGAGRASGVDNDLGNALKPILASDKSLVIAATTTEEYEKYFSKDLALRRRFEKVIVEEPGIYEVYPMIKSKVEELSRFHKVDITRDMVNFIAMYSSCFYNETKNPDRTLDLVDRSMVTAKRKKQNIVDTESVITNFAVNMELFNSMQYEEKLATAYHEAGHYIAYSFLPLLKRTLKPVVVSIYPTKNYIGATIIEKNKNVITVRSKKTYLEEIAAYLAGGVAEGIIERESNDGVALDSENATKIARKLVMETGFYDHFFYNLDSLKTDKNVEKQVEEIKKILKDSKEIANKVIHNHKRELEIVVETLMKEHVVSDEELKKAIKNAENQKQEKDT